jgi:hypothetical protein
MRKKPTRSAPYFVSFVHFVPFQHEKEARVSGYPDPAKRIVEKVSPKNTREEPAERRRRKLEEAGKWGLIISRREYSDG